MCAQLWAEAERDAATRVADDAAAGEAERRAKAAACELYARSVAEYEKVRGTTCQLYVELPQSASVVLLRLAARQVAAWRTRHN